MPSCALIDATGTVVSTIMADPSTDPAPPGFTLVALPDGVTVDQGWSYAPAKGFSLSSAARQKALLSPITIPTWNDGLAPFTAQSPASAVMAACNSRGVVLMNALGRPIPNIAACAAIKVGAGLATATDTCATFCGKVADGVSNSTIKPVFALEFMTLCGDLVPISLIKQITASLPMNAYLYSQRLLAQVNPAALT